MGKSEADRPSGGQSEKPGEGRKTRVNPEDDFSPLGGYQPRRGLAGDFVIPSGKSKALPGEADAAGPPPARAESPAGERDKEQGKKKR
jgi:hypothetical protein